MLASTRRRCDRGVLAACRWCACMRRGGVGRRATMRRRALMPFAGWPTQPWTSLSQLAAFSPRKQSSSARSCGAPSRRGT
eukprot:6880233-Lingulodinium_polyedra.AAC.1